MPIFPAIVAEVDPYLLDIKGKKRVQVSMLGFTETQSGRVKSAADIALAAKGIRFVLVGESHNNPEHHRAQANVIEALVKAGRDVTVGFEMFTRDNQDNINPFSLGWWTHEEFVEKSNWKKQWGFKYEIYKPIFEVIKTNGLPMVALNVPRDWVRQVSKQGPDSLTSEQKKWVPSLDLTNKDHRSVFDALIGGHPGTGADGMYAGQVTWDTGMAQTALDAMGAIGNARKVMVIVAGAGHMMYSQGINYRITKKTGERTLNVTCIDADASREVSASLGDYVFAAPPGKE